MLLLHLQLVQQAKSILMPLSPQSLRVNQPLNPKVKPLQNLKAKLVQNPRVTPSLSLRAMLAPSQKVTLVLSLTQS